jgi:flagellar biogenesis protein FliO
MRRIALATVFCLSLCSTVRAADSFDESRLIPAPNSGKSSRAGDKTGESARPKARNSGGAWWTTLGSLTTVLALVYLTAKVLRKGMPAAQRTLPVEVVQVLGRKPLDYRNTIHLVRCGSKLLILGSSQAGLTPLSEISDPVEVDYLAGLCKPSGLGSVADTFNLLFRKFQSPETTEAAGEPDQEANADPAVLRLQARLSHPGEPFPGTFPGDVHGEHFEEATG